MSPFLIAVLISFILSFAVGFIWYSPVLFGKTWMRLHGAHTADKATMKSMWGVMVLNLVVTIFYAAAFTFVLAILIPMNLFSLAICALGIFLGFAVPILAQNALWSNLAPHNAWKLFGITAGYQLVNAMVIAAVYWFVR